MFLILPKSYKFLLQVIVVCALVACVAAKPGAFIQPTFTAPYAAAPLAYSAPFAYAAPFAFNTPLDSASSSSRVDAYTNYNAAFYPAAPAKFVAPAAYTAPFAYTSPFAAAAVPAAPLKYTAAAPAFF